MKQNQVFIFSVFSVTWKMVPVSGQGQQDGCFCGENDEWDSHSGAEDKSEKEKKSSIFAKNYWVKCNNCKEKKKKDNNYASLRFLLPEFDSLSANPNPHNTKHLS